MLRIFMLFLILFSCNNINNKANDNIIPVAKFTDLIADIHLIEAKFETIKFKEEIKATAILQHDYDSIFSMYNVSYIDFKNSLEFYSLSNDELEKIYTNALEKIKKEKSKLD